MPIISAIQLKETLVNLVHNQDPAGILEIETDLENDESFKIYGNEQGYILRQDYWAFTCPLILNIHNITKLTSKTGNGPKVLKRHFLHHWATNFEHLTTYDDLRKNILDATACASWATTIAVNKYIRQQNLTLTQIKSLLKGSPWRWVFNGTDYVQKTFYSLINQETPTIISDNPFLHFYPYLSCVNHCSFANWLNQVIEHELDLRAQRGEDEEEETPSSPIIPPNQLLNHSAKATDFFKFKIGKHKAKNQKTKTERATSTFMGIELELEGLSSQEFETLQELKNHAIFKRDGSLNNGVEICTAPATIDVHIKEFKNFFQKIKEKNSKLNAQPNCGLHIHIDKSKISNLHLASLYLLINNDKNQIQISKLAGRAPNNYCELHKVNYNYFTSKNKNVEKYRQVNLAPSATIELRLFASTINEVDFCKRVEFAQAVVDYTRPGEVNIPIKEIPIWENFTTYVKKNTKAYPYLKQYLFPLEVRKEKPTHV